MNHQYKFPGEKKFAFSIFDDTDFSTVCNIKPVYDLLDELGLKTSKSVWSLPSNKRNVREQDTLNETKYLAFIRSIQEQGFEIAFHGARDGDSDRNDTIKAIKLFKKTLGRFPRTYANHLDNKELLYWGADRFSSPIISLFAKALFRGDKSFGHVSDSPYFWGDIAKKYINYVRNFVFSGINTVRYDPYMPYHDSAKPYVNCWFSSSDGFDVKRFNDLIRDKNQERLEKQGGICIVYTHFGYGFVRNGKVDPTTKRLLKLLSKRNGWFVPVGELLDFLLERRVYRCISQSEAMKLELRWVLNRTFRKIINGI